MQTPKVKGTPNWDDDPRVFTPVPRDRRLQLSDEWYEKRSDELLAASKAWNTRRAYRADWASFVHWCDAHNYPTLPTTPRAVELYIAYLAYRPPFVVERAVGRPNSSGERKLKPVVLKPLKPTSIQRHLSTIRTAHRIAGYEDPTQYGNVKAKFDGAANLFGLEAEPKEAIEEARLKLILQHVAWESPPTDDARAARAKALKALRDRALLLLGFMGAFRRSELCALRVDDLFNDERGLIVRMRRSKTNQKGSKRDRRAIPYGKHDETCAVRAVRHWLDAADITEGPIFRNIDRWGNIADRALDSKAVAIIVKDRVEAAGMSREPFAGHSLRSGFDTSAGKRGATPQAIGKHTKQSSRTVEGYIQDHDLWRDHPAFDLDL